MDPEHVYIPSTVVNVPEIAETMRSIAAEADISHRQMSCVLAELDRRFLLREPRPSNAWSTHETSIAYESLTEEEADLYWCLSIAARALQSELFFDDETFNDDDPLAQQVCIRAVANRFRMEMQLLAPPTDEPWMFGGLLNVAFSNVDWYQIAATIIQTYLQTRPIEPAQPEHP